MNTEKEIQKPSLQKCREAINEICKDLNFSEQELQHRSRLLFLMQRLNFWTEMGVFLDECKYQRSLVNQPTEAEPKCGYEGVGKWYVSKLKNIFFVVSDSDNLCGFGLFSGKWEVSNNLALKEDIDRLATPEEIKAAILKGCEQKGIVKGARVRCLGDGKIYTLDGNTEYTKTFNRIWCGSNKLLSVMVFDNGKFAEVVKDENKEHVCAYSRAINQEYPRKCINCGKNEFVIETPKLKPIDKELLDECYNYILKISQLYGASVEGNELMQKLKQ